MTRSATKIRIYDWHGNNAVGDDLIHTITLKQISSTARKLPVSINCNHNIFYDGCMLGGGTLLGHGVYFSRIRRIFKYYTKPYMIFGTGVRKPDTRLSTAEKIKLQDFCRKAHSVCVRGFNSAQWLAEYDIDNVIVAGDAALAFEPIEIPAPTGDFKVGICPRMVHGGLRKEEQRGSNIHDLKLLAQICDRIVKTYRADLFFFDLNHNRFDRDDEAIQAICGLMSERVAARSATVYSFTDNTDPITAFSRLGKMDFIVSKRMHPSLMSWIQGVPSIGLDYQFDKTIDAFSVLGIENCVIDIRTCTPASYIELMEYILTDAQKISYVVTEKSKQLTTLQQDCIASFLKKLTSAGTT